MFPTPTTFPTNNTHRMVLFLDQQLHGDYERIEDILANAARHTRAACEAITQLPYEALKLIQSWLATSKGIARSAASSPTITATLLSQHFVNWPGWSLNWLRG